MGLAVSWTPELMPALLLLSYGALPLAHLVMLFVFRYCKGQGCHCRLLAVSCRGCTIATGRSLTACQQPAFRIAGILCCKTAPGLQTGRANMCWSLRRGVRSYPVCPPPRRGLCPMVSTSSEQSVATTCPPECMAVVRGDMSDMSWR